MQVNVNGQGKVNLPQIYDRHDTSLYRHVQNNFNFNPINEEKSYLFELNWLNFCQKLDVKYEK